MAEWLLDGQPDAWWPPTGRGLAYGDGLFETMAFHCGRSALWARHMARLQRGCELLGLSLPDPELLLREALSLAKDAPAEILRITLVRSGPARGYAPRGEHGVHRIITRRGWPICMTRWRQQGLRLATSRHRLAPSPAGGIKHTSRIEQVLIGREVETAGADEALVLDAEDRLVEALSGNLVIERGDFLLAPNHPAAVDGVGLGWLRDRSGGDLIEEPFSASSLRRDDSIWVINSVRGPCPVESLDGDRRTIGSRLREWQHRWCEEIEA